MYFATNYALEPEDPIRGYMLPVRDPNFRGLYCYGNFLLIGNDWSAWTTHVFYKIGIYMVHHQVKSSWFVAVQNLLQVYDLKNPIFILTNPPSKAVLSKLVNKKVSDFRHLKLSDGCKEKPSLRFLWPHFLPLLQGPHPIFLVKVPRLLLAATVVARILSGRY